MISYINQPFSYL